MERTLGKSDIELPTTGQQAQSEDQFSAARQHAYFAMVALAAFGLYWFSSNVIQAADRMHLFGADTGMYWGLADDDVVDRLGDDAWLDRITRFHPVTTALAVGWMKVFSPLTPWIEPRQLLKAMFAAVGAVGVWAAMWAFAAAVPRRYVIALGIIYAASLGVWYFASVEESKIVSATLTTLYIAVYLHLRNRWTMRGAMLLTAVLLFACLNEIIAGLLLIIPMVDTLIQRGWNVRGSRWIALHGLAAPIALLFFEAVVNRYLVATGTELEGASYLSMLRFYVVQYNSLSTTTAYSFLVNWLFFNIAAPARDASFVFPETPWDKYFEPAFANYFLSPISASLIVLFGVMLVASVLPRYRAKSVGSLTGILMALGVYALVRGTFFLIVLPKESLLYASSVTLAHMLMIAMPFAASSFPAKPLLLAAFALLLFVINGRFVMGV